LEPTTDLGFGALTLRKWMSMREELAQLIKIAGVALEFEDRYLLGAIAANQAAYPGRHGGILQHKFNNERYYQFVVARALISSFPFAADIEIGGSDLVLKYTENTSKVFAVCEMKRWMTESGKPEIRKMLADLQKLRKLRDAKTPSTVDNLFLIVFSANPKGMTDENLSFLAKELGIYSGEVSSMWETYRFQTFNADGDASEFWVAGHEMI
jgi:hypothetical protein